MKTKATLTALWGCIAALSLGACGSSGSSTPAPVPTTTSTKAAVDTSVPSTNSATAAGIFAAIKGLEATPSISATKVASNFAGTFDVTCPTVDPEFTDICGTMCANGGSVNISGTISASCTLTDPTYTCSSVSVPVTIVFTDCAVTTTLSGTTYNEVMSGTVTTTATGTATGTLTDATPTSTTFGGTLTGTTTLTGDVAGTAVLTGVTYSGTTSGSSPTVTCGGTSDVTITGADAEVCTVATTCDGCTE